MKLGSLNPFQLTYLRLELKLIHLLCACADIKTHGIVQTPSLLERYLVNYMFI